MRLSDSEGAYHAVAQTIADLAKWIELAEDAERIIWSISMPTGTCLGALDVR
jgi:hypothetical protein